MTLLELIIALVLVGVLAGIGAISYVNSDEERTLRKAASEIEVLSSRGHARAVLHQKPHWLRIERGRVTLFGASDREGDEGEGIYSEIGNWDENLHEEEYGSYATDAEISIRRWGAGDEDWQQPKENEYLTWMFQGSGLCEPLAIKIEKGESWLILHMHPLTARVDEEEMSIK